jgi:hypothetical protein
MDMDFATSCPLVQPALPPIRFLFVGSRLCSTLPSDGSSRFRPCALLVLHLHQVAQGTLTPKLSDMSDTQDAARRLRRCRRIRGGILDCRCARRSAGRQVGTKGWSYSDRIKGCALDLNSIALAYHAQFAELDAHNCRKRVPHPGPLPRKRGEGTSRGSGPATRIPSAAPSAR